ncbi:hypothetical protein MNQ98_07745 [Paenibacillus sp. N3/727]|uniref:hypothetical protein n=1 Tax=Paenibacillus sp. N3/727 TaxID=2925845 RepID=UPI001F530C4B|nr:hypothetical protein [Paenibacillus sp. N3/727]UNK19898.1 hypothetical protein MNQ98_07745 [Paenibacillus sp. N3/727]
MLARFWGGRIDALQPSGPAYSTAHLLQLAERWRVSYSDKSVGKKCPYQGAITITWMAVVSLGIPKKTTAIFLLTEKYARLAPNGSEKYGFGSCKYETKWTITQVGKIFIRKILLTNSVSSGACGLLLLFFPGYVAEWTGLDSRTGLVETGVFLLVFVAFLVWTAFRSIVSPASRACHYCARLPLDRRQCALLADKGTSVTMIVLGVPQSSAYSRFLKHYIASATVLSEKIKRSGKWRGLPDLGEIERKI